MLQRTLFGLALIGLLVGKATGAVITQGAGDDYVAWSAGDYFSIINGGSSVVTDNSDGTLNTTTRGGDDSLVTYRINFVAPGDYYLYFDVFAPDANSDSIFINHGPGFGFGVAPGKTDAERWNSLFESSWHGLFQIGGADVESRGGDYTIGSPYNWNVPLAGSYDLIIRNREAGLVWERWLFSQHDDLTMAELDTLFEASTAPEPTTLALMGLGLAGFGYQRRRKPVS